MRIKIAKVRLPLKTPFKIAHGSYEYRENVFVQLYKDGVASYGEAPIVPYYGTNPEAVIADIAKATHSACQGLLSATMPFAELGFDHAVSACALQSALVGMQKDCVGDKTSFTIAYDDNIEQMVQTAQNCGFDILKIKAGIPGDIERIERIKQALPHAHIRVDANQGWSFEEAGKKIATLEHIGVQLIEEPIKGTADQLEQLALSTSVPILLDESVQDAAQLAIFVKEAPHIAGIVVKIAKCGGPLFAQNLIETARSLGLKIMLSSMVESSLGISAALSLAPLCTWLDLDAPLLLRQEPFTGLEYKDGAPYLSSRGLSPQPELERLFESIESQIVFN